MKSEEAASWEKLGSQVPSDKASNCVVMKQGRVPPVARTRMETSLRSPPPGGVGGITGGTHEDGDQLVGHEPLLQQRPGEAVGEQGRGIAEDGVGGDRGEVQAGVEGVLRQEPEGGHLRCVWGSGLTN